MLSRRAAIACAWLQTGVPQPRQPLTCSPSLDAVFWGFTGAARVLGAGSRPQSPGFPGLPAAAC